MQGTIERGFPKRKRYNNSEINYTKHVRPIWYIRKHCTINYFLYIVFQFEGYLPEFGGTFEYKMVDEPAVVNDIEIPDEHHGTYLRKEMTSQLGKMNPLQLYFLYAHDVIILL